MSRRVRAIAPSLIAFAFAFAFVALAITVATERTAHAQACCVGASGLTPGWLTNHEWALIGAQLRVQETLGTYPTKGPFYTPTPGRDTKIETSLFGSIRLLPRGQVSIFAPFDTTRRRSNGHTETKSAPGDLTLVSRYDLIRAGEMWFPGVALLGGVQVPTGPPSDKGEPLLDANVTGIGAWEMNGGVSVEQTFGHVILHTTVLTGYRFPREVLGVSSHLGWRALYLVAGGWVFDDDVSILGTITHTSDGDATIEGENAPGTGFRSTQLALLVITPITDTLRLRTSVFSDIPPLGLNKPVFGGTSISIAKSWF